MKDNKKKDEEIQNLSSLEGDILTVILAREKYGLEILNKLNTSRPTPLSFGSLYPALNRLEKKGLIRWRWGDEQEETGGARRKYYIATPLGTEVWEKWRKYRTELGEQDLGSTALGSI